MWTAIWLPTFTFIVLSLGRNDASSAKSNMVILTEDVFGTYNNETVTKFTWQTDSGVTVSVISYGAIIQSIQVPDKHGVLSDVVLGFDDLNSYVERNKPHFGGTVGRCANRIGGAKFEIDGVSYTVASNRGNDHLHGGNVGFDKVNWNSVVDGNKVIFSYLSKDLEEGYPGDLVTSVIYEVTNDNVLRVEFISTTSKKTVINLTNHSYFNLAGHNAGAVELYNHVVAINADKITETSSTSIPTGKLLDVGGTPYDLRIATRLENAMNKGAFVFDDNYCVSTHDNKGLNFISRVTHPPSGRTLEVYSNQPGVQFYTSNSLPYPSEPDLIGKDGVSYKRHGAFCLETQNFPDAINHENFPKVILSPGEIYRHQVEYRFGVEK